MAKREPPASPGVAPKRAPEGARIEYDGASGRERYIPAEDGYVPSLEDEFHATRSRRSWYDIVRSSNRRW